MLTHGNALKVRISLPLPPAASQLPPSSGLPRPTSPLPGITAGLAPTEPAPVCPTVPVPRPTPSPRHVVPHSVHQPQAVSTHVSELSPPRLPIGPEDTIPFPTGMPATGAHPLQFSASMDHHEDMHVNYISTPRWMSPTNLSTSPLKLTLPTNTPSQSH
ncbi:vegetative cell wall protein gp1-like [Homarus americanus]|uniref:vegetative cell wall protein gp1-like n=1 Tax=Homarus americanus TaxID=6706 RepID=UPI001C43DE98|nr:vegetative cell wall protein gp1-like [Homarus americanus]